MPASGCPSLLAVWVDSMAFEGHFSLHLAQPLTHIYAYNPYISPSCILYYLVARRFRPAGCCGSPRSHSTGWPDGGTTVARRSNLVNRVINNNQREVQRPRCRLDRALKLSSKQFCAAEIRGQEYELPMQQQTATFELARRE